MRVHSFPLLLLMLPALVAAAQTEHKTQAQIDQFSGSVHSVSTQVVMAPIKCAQPCGPSLIMSIPCRECEYDSEGNRIRAGQKWPDGTFFGENIEIVRDGQGHVIQRNRIDATDGRVIEQEKDGPFGPVEEIYFTGSIARTTKMYDRLGNVSEWLSFDASGQQVSRSIMRTNPDGQWTERAAWGKDAQLQYRETYDPKTDFQRFESYDDSGAVRVAFTFSNNKVQTFWEASDEPHQFGDSIVTTLDNGNFGMFSCHKVGACDVAHVHYTYADSSTHLFPATAEQRNDSGKLQNATWCAYEFDDQHNWTKRTVWVLSPETPERTLYETDTRIITYWTK